jgi:hypothetical protein
MVRKEAPASVPHSSLIFPKVAAATSALKVTPKKYVTTLTEDQKLELFQFLLINHTPAEATLMTDQAIAIDPFSIPRFDITVKEDFASQLYSEFALVGIEAFLWTADIGTIKGDGNFSGPADSILPLSFGSVALFKGRRSVEKPMKLRITLEFGH